MSYKIENTRLPSNDILNAKIPSISFETEIQLGNPKHQCQSLGICKINPSLFKETLNRNVKTKNKVNAKIVFEENKLIFFFKKAGMAIDTEQKFFGGDFFIVLSAIEMPGFISEKLNASYTIERGGYPITKEKDFYKVIF